MEKVTTTIGRLIFGMVFGVFGILHFMNGTAMATMVPEFMPGDGTFWVYFTGLCLIAASVSIITNRVVGLSCTLLASLLIIFDLTIHIPGLMSEETMSMAMSNLLKDTGLAGAALVFAGIFGEEEVERPSEKESKRVKEEVEEWAE